MNTTSVEFHHVALSSIAFSTSHAQGERRKHIDKIRLDELASSIREKGVVQPIVLRRLIDGPSSKGFSFEVVAGERRVLAARLAKLTEIPAIVRDLTDEQAQEIQLIENLQRQDLHELVEAEGYEVLAKRGMTPEEIAHKVGKSKSTVYARMKLLALGQKCRAAFHAGEISASIALLLARIPVHELQEKAFAEVTKTETWNPEPMSYRDAQEYVRDEFTLKLAGAPFPRDDATLCPKAGTCAACPKRTGNQPGDLFGDIKSADVCTDPVCFKEKRQAFAKRELEKAKATGAAVLTGNKAKSVLPDRYAYGDSKGKLRNGYVKPTDKCESDPKKRTYAELAGKDAQVTLIQHPETGRTSRAFAIADIKQALKDKGVTVKEPSKDKPRSTSSSNEEYEARRAKQEAEEKLRAKVVAEVIKQAPCEFGREQLVQLVAAALDRMDTDDMFQVCGLEKPKRVGWGRERVAAIANTLTPLPDKEIHRLANVAVVIEDLTNDYGEWKEVVAAAKQLGVDAQKVRDGIEAAATAAAPAEKPAKKAKKVKP